MPNRKAHRRKRASLPSKAGEPVKETKGEVSDKYNDEAADVTIVSSDGVEFKVHGYQLMAHRDLLQAGLTSTSTGTRIPLSDDDDEDRHGVGYLLDAMHGDIPDVIIATPRRMEYTINLLQKYDCVALLDNIKWRVRAAAGLIRAGHKSKASPLYLFTHSARLGDPEGCRLAILGQIGKDSVFKVAPSGSVADEGETSSKQSISGASHFDVTSWSIGIHQMVPMRYVVALAQAGRHIKRDHPSQTDWQNVADEFYRVITA